MSTPTITARKAGPADHAAVRAAMARAFFDDPIFGWAVPDDEQRSAMLPAFFDLALRAFARHDQTWCVGEDVPVGGAIWSPAGVEPMDETTGEWFGARCVELPGVDVDRFVEVNALLEDNHPRHTDHHYLWLLGVQPGSQGAGLGSAMLRAVLDRADRDGVPAYLEATSEGNRRLYERHGFVVTGELALAGGPSLWAMWRDPQR